MKIACERCKKITDADYGNAVFKWRLIQIKSLGGNIVLTGYLCDECYDKLLDFMNAEEE